MSSAEVWRRCATCKKPIGFASGYFTCSVSTCNRSSALFVFCSVGCWDGHLPVMRHRDAWAVEATSPSATESTMGSVSPSGARGAVAVRTSSADVRGSSSAPLGDAPPSHASAGARPSPATAAVPARDVLVVVSKLKLYIRQTSGMSTSDGIVEVLSDHLRALCDGAVEKARVAGRKTVLERDFHGVR